MVVGVRVSRSRWPKCSTGRGCWVCGDAGLARRKKERDAQRIDERELDDPWYTMIVEDIDRTYIDDQFELWPEMDRK